MSFQSKLLVVFGVAMASVMVTAQIVPSEGQRPTFRAAVNLVRTDDIVRDGDGVFVPDLTKEDFRGFEDDIEQEVASLVLVHGGRVFNLEAPPPPVAQEGIILPPRRPPTDIAGRVFVIFVDDLHLGFSNTGRLLSLIHI